MAAALSLNPAMAQPLSPPNRPSRAPRLRPFSTADQAAVRQLVLAGLQEHFGRLDPNLNPDLDDIAAHYLAAGHQFWVVELDGQIVGCGGLVAEDEQTGRIVRVSVSREQRGRGIGRLVVEKLLALGRQRGYRRLVVETNHDWTAALALYQSCGFATYDRDEESFHLQMALLKPAK
jgi:ribosomal protein S18 acetylase RimI-like enzyme